MIAPGTEAPDGPLTAIARAKLLRMLGEDKGSRTFREALSHLGMASIDTPKQLLQLATHLIALGGLTKMIGHSLMMEALLRGAQA